MSIPIDLHNSNQLLSEETDIRNYLYMAANDSQPIFHGIQEDMAQLNDFCLLCIDTTSKQLADLRRTVKRYQAGELRAHHPDLGDITSDAEWALEEFEIPRWQETEEFMVRAMCLILLSAFVEKSLIELTNYLAPREAPRCKRKAGETETGALIRHLRQICGLHFEEPESSRAIREKCRRIRNDFAHGRWDAVKVSIADQSLSAAFGAVTDLFDAIDGASAIHGGKESGPDLNL